MIRTNEDFLSYAKQLYDDQSRKDDIVIKHYSKGSLLLMQGEELTRVMFICRGIAKVFFSEENGKQFILEFLGKGEVIGEIELLRNISCLCSIEAMTDISVYSFSLPYFRLLIQTDMQLNNMLLQVFAERIINTSSRASYQQLYTVDHSLSKLLEFQENHQLGITKEDMAAYLGITIRTLNRSLQKIGKDIKNIG
ncbi:Crp/Fnr family transcriptional regulator [Sphingobacterium psychroaquaticum]|uniref:cAMP-binding domain of CRP or a regulatory subunit of cAMP-dependent protein kinases n=1 Tax=Sphingobacterium psychroaquaticum TaxID=561061 RepID=A0A1X7JQ40_9SPHI|nr:Crp/Fnr family transcriptional regulator [Sphingobacterium psychroaquaticum]QBQ43023.1 Crp/Fnr family transcriptional regulator [Sphingobacterium psychroaquaticum]SMG29802.1 cAMP-binding domain of CRP or a regulatory subunit of cAMP-dependent protein kinases [Sphingobacterium psychroaquaticum]